MNPMWDYLLKSGFATSDIEVIKQIYILLLLLPIVATIVGIARYIIGTKSLSIYAPIIMTFLFYELGKVSGGQDVLTGLKYGLILFVTVFISSTLFYSLLKKFRMNYVPKLTLVLTGVSLSLAVLIFISLLMGKNGLIFINQYTFIIITIISEPLISVIARKSFKYSLISALDTLAISVFSYLLISIQSFQDLIANNPWIIIVIILVNIYVGRFAGLRFTEYWRFRDILFADNKIVDDKPSTNTAK